MKKLLSIIIGMFLLSTAAMPQRLPRLGSEFHIVYIRLDKTMDYKQVVQKFTTLIEKIENSKNKFVVLFSNSKLISSKKSEIINELKKWSSVYAFKDLILTDEIEVFNKIIDNNKISQVKNGEVVLNNISSLVIDVFVGNDFVLQNFQNLLLYRTLLVNGFQNTKIAINYYNASHLETADILGNELYQKNQYQINLK
jgi:hypothetical protein